MPQYGGDLIQSAPSGSAIRVLQVPTIVDRDRLSSTGVVRVDGQAFVDATQLTYQWNGVTWDVVPSSSPTVPEVADQASLATIPAGSLVVGDRWRVATWGTKWRYTGLEAAAPDPADPDAWELAGPADELAYQGPFVVFLFTQISVYVDPLIGDDFFGEGTLASPFKTLQRVADQAPYGAVKVPDVFITGGGDPVWQIVSPRFGQKGGMSIFGETSLVDLDGVGTTEFTASANVRNIIGKEGVGVATGARNYQVRVPTDVTFLAAVQQPVEGAHVVYKVDDFGFPGLAFPVVGGALCRVDTTLNVLAPTELTTTGGSFGGDGVQAGSGWQIHNLLTGVDTTDAFPIQLHPGADFALRIYNVDLGTTVAAAGKQYGAAMWDGDVIFSNCLFVTTGSEVSGNSHKLPVNNSAGPFASCVFLGNSTSASRVTYRSPMAVTLTMQKCLFKDTSLQLAKGTLELTNIVFRGTPSPGVSSNNSWITVGTDRGTDGEPLTGCLLLRAGCDFERLPFAAAPSPIVNGAPISNLGNANQVNMTGSQGAGTIDVDGAWYRGAFASQLIGVNIVGSFGKPGIFRHGARLSPAVTVGVTTTVIGALSNYVTPGADLQLGVRHAGSAAPSEDVAAFASLPLNDFGRVDPKDIEGIVLR